MTERFSYYKNNYVLLKKGRRQRNRIAVSLLTIALPLELRHSSIRPLNEETRRLGWWENKERLMNTTRCIPRNPEKMAGAPQGVRELRLGVSVAVTFWI